MDRITNNAGINLVAACWLAHDDYDYVDKPNYISVTTLIKPIRQIVLPMRIPAADRVPDIVDRIQARIGQALHSDVENVWKNHYKTSLAKLGYPKRVIDAIRINPVVQEPDTLPVHTEVRTEKTIGGYTVGGKIDIIIEYRLHDVKKTSVFGYQNQKGIGTTWLLQGSLYRWLNPEKIHHDELFIQYLLLDWVGAFAKRDPNYPPHAVPTRSVKLMGVQETERWVLEKLRLLQQYLDAPEEDLPECSEEDLWRTEPVYKFYANADAPAGARSTKNFDTLQEAMQHKADKGKGRVERVPGLVKACNYCAAAPLCSQRERLLLDGSLAQD